MNYRLLIPFGIYKWLRSPRKNMFFFWAKVLCKKSSVKDMPEGISKKFMLFLCEQAAKEY